MSFPRLRIEQGRARRRFFVAAFVPRPAVGAPRTQSVVQPFGVDSRKHPKVAWNEVAGWCGAVHRDANHRWAAYDHDRHGQTTRGTGEMGEPQRTSAAFGACWCIGRDLLHALEAKMVLPAVEARYEPARQQHGRHERVDDS